MKKNEKRDKKGDKKDKREYNTAVCDTTLTKHDLSGMGQLMAIYRGYTCMRELHMHQQATISCMYAQGPVRALKRASNELGHQHQSPKLQKPASINVMSGSF